MQTIIAKSRTISWKLRKTQMWIRISNILININQVSSIEKYDTHYIIFYGTDQIEIYTNSDDYKVIEDLYNSLNNPTMIQQ